MSDEFKFFPADTKDPIGKYTQPKGYSKDLGGKENVGYPDVTPNTQTMKMRGAGAATKGNKTSTRMA